MCVRWKGIFFKHANFPTSNHNTSQLCYYYDDLKEYEEQRELTLSPPPNIKHMKACKKGDYEKRLWGEGLHTQEWDR